MKRLFSSLMLASAAPAMAVNCADLASPARFDAESAMKAIFCEYNVERGGTLLPLKFTAGWQAKQAETLAKPLLVANYREGAVEKGVLVVARQMLEEGEPWVSHGQTAEISIYLFRQIGEKWVYEKGKKSVTSAGSYGEPPGAKLIRLGKEKYGLQFDADFCNQGYCEGNMFLVPLSEATFGVVGEFPISGDNGGTGEEESWEFTGAVEAVDTGGEYYTLRMVYEGTAPGDGEEPVVPHPSPICYRKGAGNYAVVEEAGCATGKALPKERLYPTAR